MQTSLPSDSEFWEKFARHIAHQLSNPIASISASAYLLDEISHDGEADERTAALEPFIASIREDSARLKALVDEFKRFFSTNSILPNKVDILGLLRLWSLDWKERGISVDIVCDEEQSSVMASLDAGILQSAFLLLVDELSDLKLPEWKMLVNSNGATVKLSLKLVGELPNVENEYIEQFFELNPSRQGAGLGLRMPTFRRVIELHEGTVNLPKLTEVFAIEICLPSAG